MTLSVTIGGTDVTDRVRLEDGFQTITANADGTFASCGLKVDDPDSSLIIGRFQEVVIEEDDCSDPRLFTGYVIEARPSRGSFRSGVERVWNIDVGDLNVLLHLQAFVFASAKRPQETGTARRDWVLATYNASYFVNNGHFPAFSGTFDEADYRGQYVDSVLTTFGDIGRIFFLYWDAPDVAVYCAGADDGFATSTLSISNLLSDVDNSLVFAPAPDAELEIDMSEVYDEIYVTGPFGSYFLSHHDTRLPPGIHRTGVFELSRVGRMTTAQAEAQILLDRHAGDAESITCTILLPSDKVNLIQAGMLVPVKFTHLPGYTAYTNLRVAQRSVNIAPVRDVDAVLYLVTLKLNLRGVSTIGGGGGTGVFPHQTTPPSLVQYKISSTGGIVLDSDPTPGNILLGWSAIRAGTWDTATQFTEIASITQGVGRSGKMVYRTVQTGDTASGPPSVLAWDSPNQGISILMEWAGVDTIDTFASLSNQTAATSSTTINSGGSVTPTSGVSAVVVGGTSLTDGDLDIVSVTPATGVTELLDDWGTLSPYGWLGYKIVSSTSGSYTISGTATNSHEPDIPWGGVTVVLTSSGSATDSPPLPGQWVYGEVVTMSGASGTTAFPYASGSLIVHVDGVLISRASYAETDNTTGDFTLSWTPNTDEVVTVDYQGI